MGRRKKEVVVETPVEMTEEAMNAPVKEENDGFVNVETENVVEPVSEETQEEAPVEEAPVVEEPVEEAPVVDETPKALASEPVFKKIQCGASLVNVRAEPDGEVLFTIRNLSKVKVEEEKDGWCKISGFVMAELVKDL